VFTTGSNTWHRFDHFPPREAQPRTWHLASRGRANAARGDGRLLLAPDPAWVEPDQFVDDPSLPFVAGVALAGEPGSSFDLREREQHHETLVYDSGPLAEPLTLLGEGVADLHVAADAPDADVILWLAEHRADGATVRLAFGQLRLRYREGFDAERLLLPGEPVAVRIPITYVAHTLPAGSHLRLLVGGNNFPLADPNPHTGEPVATASTWRRAVQTVFHDPQRPSRLTWPVLA
jgi:putative CocE/NonD family hydrolase